MESSARRAGLSRDKVLRAALELADRDGIEKLSMRRLGAELGVEAMTLYHYVPNKAALLDGLVEQVVSAVRPALDGGAGAGADALDRDGQDRGAHNGYAPAPGTPATGTQATGTQAPRTQDPAGWPERLRAFAVAFRDELLRHPGVIPLVATRPARSPAALQAVEDTAAALVRAGLTPLMALRVVNAVATMVVGHCLAEAATTPGHPEPSEPELDLTAFPTLTAAVTAGLGTPADHAARFTLALDALLTGLRQSTSR